MFGTVAGERSKFGGYGFMSSTQLNEDRQSPLKVPDKATLPFHWKGNFAGGPTLVQSFRHALNGVRLGFRTERNLRIHFGCAAIVFVLAIVLKIDYLGCLALTLAVGIVLTAEFINTALEHLVDIAVGQTYHLSAKAAKDTAAAAVLMASCCALIVGVTVLGPRLVQCFQNNNNMSTGTSYSDSSR